MIQSFILYPLCIFGTLVLIALILSIKIENLYEAADKEKTAMGQETDSDTPAR